MAVDFNRDHPHQADCSRARAGPQTELCRVQNDRCPRSRLGSGLDLGHEGGPPQAKCMWLLVPSAMRNPRRQRVPPNTMGNPSGKPWRPLLSPLHWGIDGTEKRENMLDPGRRQGCRNQERNKELRRECLWLWSRGQKVDGTVDDDWTVDWRDVPGRSDSNKMNILFVSADSPPFSHPELHRWTSQTQNRKQHDLFFT